MRKPFLILLPTVIGRQHRAGTGEEPQAQLGLPFALGGGFDHLDLTLGQPLRSGRDVFATAGLAITF